MANPAPVNQMLPLPKLFVFGIQHVLVMYAGAVAVPLIIGRALKLPPEQVTVLISADLFCCGLVSILQSWGIKNWVGIKLPVMMGVSFAAVGPMLALANTHSGLAGAQLIFGSILGAGLIALLLSPFISRLIRFFPPVVTGSIILTIGITLMRIGINWIFGNPFGPTAPRLVNPIHSEWLNQISKLAASGGVIPPLPEGLALAASQPNAHYASLSNIALATFVMLVILVLLRFAKGFWANISVLLGILIGGILTAVLGLMNFDQVAKADWVGIVLPLQFGVPTFELIPVLTMSLVMIVIMVESIGMFLALGEMTGKKIGQKEIARGLRGDALGSMLGGLFNTFPYTSFSQNVGLVGVTGISSRYVCVAGGIIMVVLGLIPKLASLVEALPIYILGGAGLVMFGMVAATGIRILSQVDFQNQKNNLFVVAISIGFGMIPLIAPDFKMWLPASLHPLIDSGIVLASFMAIVLNIYFGGAKNQAQVM